ncbi:MAG: CRISPR-associated endonuclease Cas1 [Candidatus Ratteibacteria bacterium]|jgi:CRISPR-associated protein Cas1
MATLYLIEQGSKLKKVSQRLVVEKNNEILFEMPSFTVERVCVFGNIQITTQALRFLLEAGIDTALFSYYGRFMGRVQPVESKNVFLRINQYEKWKSETERLRIAKILLLGKIQNSRALLLKYSRNHPDIDFTNHIKQLEFLAIELDRKTLVSSVMGVEGRAAAIYFECFSAMILKNFTFFHRIPRHSKDPVNSMLSFGYALLTNEVFSALCGVGFDVYVGYLHSLVYGRPALALDLMEEFRQPIADRLVLELINKGSILPNEFQETEEGLYLNDESRKKFLAQYERRMQTKTSIGEKAMNYRDLIHGQISLFAKLINDEAQYTPFLLK